MSHLQFEDGSFVLETFVKNGEILTAEKGDYGGNAEKQIIPITLRNLSSSGSLQ